MFTGIVEGLGKVVSLEPRGADGLRMVVDAGALAEGVGLGDSVAHNGCCLTVTSVDGTKLGYDLLHETRARTNLRHLTPGAKVNLERSLAVGARIGGHFVTGHIDGTGRLASIQPQGADVILRVELHPEEMRYLVPKGCIAVDGMSLTVVDVGPDFFTLWIIPHTLTVTTLGDRREGDEVNLEFDLLAKYTEKLLAKSSG